MAVLDCYSSHGHDGGAGQEKYPVQAAAIHAGGGRAGPDQRDGVADIQAAVSVVDCADGQNAQLIGPGWKVDGGAAEVAVCVHDGGAQGAGGVVGAGATEVEVRLAGEVGDGVVQAVDVEGDWGRDQRRVRHAGRHAKRRSATQQ